MDPQEFDDFVRWEPTYPASVIGSGLLYCHGKGILYGRYKAWKSILCMNLALSVADGKEWVGFSTPEGGANVLYVQLEVPHSLLHKRFMKMWQGWCEDNYNGSPTRPHSKLYFESEPFLKLDSGQGFKQLEGWIQKYEPTLVILDPLYKLISGNILDPNAVRSLVDYLDLLLSKYPFALMIAHHPRKSALHGEGAEEWGSDDMLGAAVFSYWADSVIKVSRIKSEKDRDTLRMNFDVVRHAEELIEERKVIVTREQLRVSWSPDMIVV